MAELAAWLDFRMITHPSPRPHSMLLNFSVGFFRLVIWSYEPCIGFCLSVQLLAPKSNVLLLVMLTCITSWFKAFIKSIWTNVHYVLRFPLLRHLRSYAEHHPLTSNLMTAMSSDNVTFTPATLWDFPLFPTSCSTPLTIGMYTSLVYTLSHWAPRRTPDTHPIIASCHLWKTTDIWSIQNCVEMEAVLFKCSIASTVVPI